MEERLISEHSGEVWLSPPAVLILMGGTAYGDGSDATPEGRQRARLVVDSLLSAARAGGFTQGDVLCTLFARGESSRRVVDMAEAAIKAAGPGALERALQCMGVRIVSSEEPPKGEQA